MDYKKIYDNLIYTRKSLQENRKLDKKQKIKYYEAHHIIPICKGGEGKTSQWRWHSNIILLTAREHFLSHWLLWRIYRDRSSALGFHKMMSNTKKQNRVTNSRGYEEARIAFCESQRGNTYAKGHTKVISEEQRKNHSKIMKGKFAGDKNPSKQPGVGQKISQKLKGVKKSHTHVEKIREALKNRPKIACKYCNLEYDKTNYMRWHGEKCNKRIITK
jgi:hypothetical protein